jgi:hypothetical protein
MRPGSELQVMGRVAMNAFEFQWRAGSSEAH